MKWLGLILICLILQGSGAVAGKAEEEGGGGGAKGQPAFPAGSRVVQPTSLPSERKPAVRRDRLQRKVREPLLPARGSAQPRPTREPKPAHLPERLGREREREIKSIQKTDTGPVARIGEEAPFAPYGRLLKCELVFTVDSLSLKAPIVALLMEDVAWEGEVVIPAGTEVFGHAVPNRVHNRIGDDGEWTLVLPAHEGGAHGREWRIKGLALDRAEVEVDSQGAGRSWSESDGAPGLQGYVIEEASEEKIQLFLATALAGAVRGLSHGLKERVLAAGSAGRRGDTVEPRSLRNAALDAVGEGAEASLERLAQQILGEIQKNGAYVRVPAGKTFYLFVEQTLDARQAVVGLRNPQP